eukprot:1161332-Pelagomonas_calceolata.AAC.16
MVLGLLDDVPIGPLKHVLIKSGNTHISEVYEYSATASTLASNQRHQNKPVAVQASPKCGTGNGFLENVRQRRAAGLAAIELAQAVQDVVAARRCGNQCWVSELCDKTNWCEPSSMVRQCKLRRQCKMWWQRTDAATSVGRVSHD